MADRAKGTVVSVNVSSRKGEAKRPVAKAVFREGHGIEGDVHAGPGERQVSLLAWEAVQAQVELMRREGVTCPKAADLAHGHAEGARARGRADDAPDIRPGDYAENLTAQGVDLAGVSPGARIEVGREVLLEVTRIGKECHTVCAVYARLGDCVMPREGVFARVLRGGRVRAGDDVRLVLPE